MASPVVSPPVVVVVPSHPIAIDTEILVSSVPTCSSPIKAID